MVLFAAILIPLVFAIYIAARPAKEARSIALAGTVGALLAKGVFDLFWPALSAPLGWRAAAVMGLLVSVAGMIGDLVESLLKRDAHTKDSGQMLPGMGGIMDRIDSPLLGIPVMYYLMIFYIFLQMAAP